MFIVENRVRPERKKRKRERAHDGQIKACLCLREKRARRMRGGGGGGGGQRDEGASLLKEGSRGSIERLPWPTETRHLVCESASLTP